MRQAVEREIDGFGAEQRQLLDVVHRWFARAIGDRIVDRA